MAVQAVQAIRPMRGGSQSQLMMDADSQLWVVKFQNNPQGVRVLANEWLATGLAKAIGLPVPRVDIVNVSEQLTNDPGMYMDLRGGARGQFLPGEHFGSFYAGGLMPGFVVDYLPERQLAKVRNLFDFAGALAFDKWTGNCDGRQAVFKHNARELKYSATFIDHGFCFNAGEWDFFDSPIRGTYARDTVYDGVTGWSSFEPWLSRIENMDYGTMWRIAETVPRAWCGDRYDELQPLIEKLFARCERVRDLITEFRNSSRQPFPLWFGNS